MKISTESVPKKLPFASAFLFFGEQNAVIEGSSALALVVVHEGRHNNNTYSFT